MLGALLFRIYIIPLAQLIRSYGLNNHGYADDTQLCLSFKKTSDNAIVKREILNLEKCLCDISVWMSQNKLKLNNDKTEIILFGSKKHLAELNIKSLSVAGTDVSVSSDPVLQCSPNWNTTGFDCKAAATTKQCSKDSIENQEV